MVYIHCLSRVIIGNTRQSATNVTNVIAKALPRKKQKNVKKEGNAYIVVLIVGM